MVSPVTRHRVLMQCRSPWTVHLHCQGALDLSISEADQSPAALARERKPLAATGQDVLSMPGGLKSFLFVDGAYSIPMDFKVAVTYDVRLAEVIEVQGQRIHQPHIDPADPRRSCDERMQQAKILEEWCKVSLQQPATMQKKELG